MDAHQRRQPQTAGRTGNRHGVGAGGDSILWEQSAGRADHIMKGVIRYAYMSRRRLCVKTVVRQIKDVKEIRSQSKAVHFRDMEPARWTTGRIWRLCAGVARIDYADEYVLSWSPDDVPPMYWGCNTVSRMDSDDLAAWGWFHLSDFPDDKFINPTWTDAARLARKYLDWSSSNLLEERCPKCFASVEEIPCYRCDNDDDECWLCDGRGSFLQCDMCGWNDTSDNA